jgi:hypothetical protein
MKLNKIGGMIKMKNKILKCMVFSMFIILMANLVAGAESLVVEKDLPITWTTEPNDYLEYERTAVDDECVIVVPEGGTSKVSKGCNTYTAVYGLSGPVQPSVPFYPDGIAEISVTVETHSFLFDKSDFMNGFAEIIKNDFSLKGLEITEEFESNYYIIWGAYPDSNLRDTAIGWYSGDKVIVIILSKWDESKVDDDVLNDLTKEYTGKYPIAPITQPPIEEISEETRCDVKDILSEGETKVYRVGQKDYEIEVSSIGEEVKFRINGQTSVLAEGETYKLMDGSKINLIHILFPTGETIAPRAEFCFEGVLGGIVEIPEEPIERRPVYVDLAVYPSFFVKEGKLDAYIIVGDTAPSSDVIAATDIASGLREYSPRTVRFVSEVGNEISENNNFIIVGNEAVEKLDSENLLDLEPWGKGEGVIQVFKDRDFVILTVTGSTEMDIRNAAKVLSKWEHFKLRGDRVKVLLDRMGNLVLSYPPFEDVSVEVVKPELYEIPEIVEPIEVPIPTCYDGVKNDGETGIDCGGPCKPCVATSETCMTGCLTDSACLPFGTRIVEDGASMFCDLNQQFNEQKGDGEVCQNSYECISNSCHSGKCVDLEKEIIETRGILEKILNWLKEFLE